MKHNIVTVTLNIIHNMFQPYMDIFMCHRYGKMFIALLTSILKLKLKLLLKFNLNSSPLLNLVKAASISLCDLLASSSAEWVCFM
jgi:hypothetical protein